MELTARERYQIITGGISKKGEDKLREKVRAIYGEPVVDQTHIDQINALINDAWGFALRTGTDLADIDRIYFREMNRMTKAAGLRIC